LIESAPKYRRYLAAAIAGYRSELRRMLDAQAIYLGPRK
jgi:hypothetical protein